jgi:hypothetical protein
MSDNRQNFLWRYQAGGHIKYLVTAYASRCEVKKDEQGYWLNVWWHCGVVAPLTIQEYHQSLGE